ncbi:GGDEF domain-containing protein [Rhizobium sp. CAU 1783]
MAFAGMRNNLAGGRVDVLLRFRPDIDALYEADNGEARTRHLRHTALVGLILYNLYNITSFYLLSDIHDFTVLVRVLVQTPACLVILWAFPRVSAFWREFMVLPAMLGVTLFSVAVVLMSKSPLAAYTLGELSLALVFANMLIAFRFRYALAMTLITCAVTIAGLSMKAGLDDGLRISLMLQMVICCIFTLYANWHAEFQRCRSYLAELDARTRAATAEEIGSHFRDLSRTDALTGLPNRRHLDEELSARLERGVPLAVMMVDVDFFKLFNDRLGHTAGDECLRRIGAALAESAARAGGFAARLGGEEFTLLVDGDETAGRALAEDAIETIRALSLAHPGRPDGAPFVTVSIGIAWGRGETPQTAHRLIARADRALYEAKRDGRDRLSAAA